MQGGDVRRFGAARARCAGVRSWMERIAVTGRPQLLSVVWRPGERTEEEGKRLWYKNEDDSAAKDETKMLKADAIDTFLFVTNPIAFPGELLS